MKGERGSKGCLEGSGECVELLKGFHRGNICVALHEQISSHISFDFLITMLKRKSCVPSSSLTSFILLSISSNKTTNTFGTIPPSLSLFVSSYFLKSIPKFVEYGSE